MCSRQNEICVRCIPKHFSHHNLLRSIRHYTDFVLERCQVFTYRSSSGFLGKLQCMCGRRRKRDGCMFSALLSCLFSSSLELLGQQEDTDWGDTVKMYKDEVRKGWVFWFLKNSVLRYSLQAWKWHLLCYRKRCYVTTCLKGCATSGWTGKELSVVLGTETGKLESSEI